MDNVSEEALSFLYDSELESIIYRAEIAHDRGFFETLVVSPQDADRVISYIKAVLAERALTNKKEHAHE